MPANQSNESRLSSRFKSVERFGVKPTTEAERVCLHVVVIAVVVVAVFLCFVDS